MTAKLKKDLLVWKAVVQAAKRGVPLGDPARGLLVLDIMFVSDAAGAAYRQWGESRVNGTQPGDQGAASFSKSDGKCRWPYHLMVNARDSEGREFGSKSAVLEAVGLLPVLQIRIRSDLKLFAGSGSVILCFRSGSGTHENLR